MTQIDHLETIRAGAVMAAISTSQIIVVPGPETIVVLGVHLPLMSMAFGVLGVVLGLMSAPQRAAPVGLRRRIAGVVTLVALVIAIVIATGQLPLVALGWGVGLGFSGPTIVETLGAQAVIGVRRISDAFIAALAARLGGKSTKGDGNG